MSEPSIAEQAYEMASQLESVVNALPAYATRPNLSIGAGIRLARMVHDLAKQVEDLARRIEQGQPGFGPCECVCPECTNGGHCDRASCAQPDGEGES